MGLKTRKSPKKSTERSWILNKSHKVRSQKLYYLNPTNKSKLKLLLIYKQTDRKGTKIKFEYHAVYCFILRVNSRKVKI